jgi:hypothetical protein
MVGIGGIETLLDDREILVLGEGPVVVGIGGGQLFGRPEIQGDDFKDERIFASRPARALRAARA